MRRIASSLLTLALAGAGLQAQAETLKVEYDLSLAGLPLGSANLSSTFEGAKYQMEGRAKLSGLVRLLTGGKGVATASGTLSEAKLQPAGFSVTAKTSGAQRTVRMGLKSGNVASVEIDPPLEPKADRIPVKEADKKGVVDPVSALIMPAIASKSPTDPANCDRTIPVFDGASRFNVVLSYDETKTADGPGYAGPVLVCSIRYVPISGHRAERPGTKFMTENKEMSVWLAPVEGRRVLFPVRVAVRTMLGMSVAEASSWAVEGDSKLTRAASRPVKAKDAVKAGAAQ
jgi:hypothetical protein